MIPSSTVASSAPYYYKGGLHGGYPPRISQRPSQPPDLKTPANQSSNEGTMAGLYFGICGVLFVICLIVVFWGVHHTLYTNPDRFRP
ncbi:hypothetical protein DdX_16197 [Ditylenchus destructor]|uniref:Uncharacterized protein n=1 Tax=Ditylenchus destructor TaxID=166010 RepID=A0AAD4MQ01_9BILA|nr:hypothetical protein DdX_16197 [Ditylenchus destructor]